MVLSLSTSGSSTATVIRWRKPNHSYSLRSLTEPSDELEAALVKTTEGRRMALSSKSSTSVTSLIGWLVCRLVGFGVCSRNTEI